MEVEYCPTENMREDVCNNSEQGKVLREFRGYLMNFEVDYDNEVERNNTIDRIVGVILVEVNDLKTVKERLSYSEEVQT